MKKFIDSVNWNRFLRYEIYAFLFFTLSYFLGNNKFPHNVCIIPVATFVLGIWLLITVKFAKYLGLEDNKTKNQDEQPKQ